MLGIGQTLGEVQQKRFEEAHLFNNFKKYYEKRDMVKASELLWGSISKITYSIGLFYGKKCGKHKEIVALIRDLAKDHPKIVDWINSAEALHSNFYHNWMDEEMFENNVRKVAELRNWLLKMLDEETEKAKQTLI